MRMRFLSIYKPQHVTTEGLVQSAMSWCPSMTIEAFSTLAVEEAAAADVGGNDSKELD